MTDTPPPRRALATFLRRPAAGAAQSESAPPVGTEGPAPENPERPAAEPASEATPPDVAASPEAAAPFADPGMPAPAPEPGVPEAKGAAAPDAASGEAHTETASPAIADAEPPLASSSASLPAADWRAAALPIAAPHAPTFARPRATVRAPRAPAWQWIALCVLALLLVLQILLADRARLATDARWRPLLSTMCGVLRCELPVWHEPAAFSMLDRDVRPAADQPGVLRIQASFRNDARWSQAWPYLQLSLSDADGRVIGSRVFSPEDYLGHAPPAGETLAPGQSGRVDFRVREPAAGTAAFTFDFH